MGATEQDLKKFQEYLSDPAARAAFVEMKAQHASEGAATRYQHILGVVGTRPWAIEDAMLAVIVDILSFRAFGGRLTAEEIEARVAPARRNVDRNAPQGVARIPVTGVLTPRSGSFDAMSGGTSAERIGDQISEAVASPQVGSIVLDIDSPGGMVDGIPELAAMIREARDQKPVVAVANTEALSAAYWLASQADRIIASPSARVGSIGVISTHEDRSAQAATKGVATTIISAGKYKAEGNPFEPLGEEAKAHMQSMVDEFYSMFVKDVAAGRGVAESDVRSGYGQGRFMGAGHAMEAGLIDGIDTIDNVLAGELAMLNDSSRPAAAGATTRLVVAAPLATTTFDSTDTANELQLAGAAAAKAADDLVKAVKDGPEDEAENNETNEDSGSGQTPQERELDALERELLEGEPEPEPEADPALDQAPREASDDPEIENLEAELDALSFGDLNFTE